MKTKQIQIAVIDHYHVHRKNMHKLIDELPNMHCACEASNGIEFVQKQMDIGIDVIVLDVNLPLVDGLHITRRIKAQNKHVKMLMISMNEDSQHLHELQRAGVDGFLCRSFNPQELESAIKKVKSGGQYCSPTIICKNKPLAPRHPH